LENHDFKELEFFRILTPQLEHPTTTVLSLRDILTMIRCYVD